MLVPSQAMDQVNGSADANTSTVEKMFRLEDLPMLCQTHCRIKDRQKVELIINEFIYGGPNRLQLVSDFDFTITKQRTNDGTPVLSSFGIFNACKSLPANFIEESKRLYKKYRPIEIDPHLPTDEKIKHMIDWWSKSSDLLIGVPFDAEEIDHVAVKFKDSLRDHSHELFATLNRLDIPVLVFSAGLGDSVVSVLKQANILYPNVKVVSNFLQYSANGLLDGLSQPMIHTFNKNETALQDSEYYDLVHSRDHIIVMGDSLGDSEMAAGVPASSHIIKIGFLFDHVEDNLEKYMNVFDIVLVDDQTMDVPRALLTLIEEQHKFDVKKENN